LLVPNGIMLILEVTKTRRWTTMIDGLAEGWWYFADEDIRKVSPLLSPQEWENVLRKQGFRSVRVYPQNEEKRAETDYALIVVQQPSEIRTDDYLNWVSEIRRKEKQLVQDAVRKVKALEDLGAEVLVTRADVANGEQVQAAINQTCECLGGIHGVIHATEPNGAREARAFVGVSRADCEWYFQPKVHGVFALERALQGKQLDFGLLIHSSSPSWEGSEGVADSAANLFLDAYASNSKAHKRHWMSVNWDVRQCGEEKAQNRAAEPAIIPEEGREAFQRLLSMDAATQVVVSPRYLQAWADLWSKPGSVAGRFALLEAGFAECLCCAKQWGGTNGRRDLGRGVWHCSDRPP
jgi:hypothetical protein